MSAPPVPFPKRKLCWPVGEALRPSVLSIPPHRAFADALATGIIAQFGADRMAMARGTILVPNNRAAQAITEAFVRKAETGLLLPRLVAIGDPDLDERTGAMLDPLDGDAIPPAIDPLRRQFMLARLIQQERALAKEPVDMAEAMRLAGDLGRVLDQLHVERKSARDLAGPKGKDELSRHWQNALDQLAVILVRWPEELARIGLVDLAARRNLQLEAVADRWRSHSPPGFVIAAGISTTAPAIADLLRVVAFLPFGQVVLAGLDQIMPDEEWAAIAGSDEAQGIETHPQFHLAQLLDRMGVGRGEVTEWRWGGGDADARAGRSKALSLAMAPPRFTGVWETLTAPARALSGVHALELATPAEEAQAIAIALREALDHPGKTAALVTPDRDLAKRVSALLGRWGIEADDSAGKPLSATLPGSLLLELATAAVEQFAPAPLLTLLKHPLVQSGENRLAWLDTARALDLALRGPRPAPGLAGVAAFLEAGDSRTRHAREAAQDGWAQASALLAAVEVGFADVRATLTHYLATLRQGVSSLAGDAIWSGREGRMLADLITEIEIHAEHGPQDVKPEALPQLLRHLLDTVSVRPAHGGHPRIAIWGLLEAKLQSAQLMILAGLNETVWPALPTPDPWLAPAIRKELGLPSLERRIGLSAHDLTGAMGAPEVLLTRARRDATAPAIASRFWLRLETMTGGLPAPALRYDQLARQLDTNIAPPLRSKRPAPCPAAVERPREISVTEVDTLNADPFAFYARKMLKLSRLDAVDADPGPAWRGTLVHDALDKWAREDNYDPDALRARIAAALGSPGIHPLIRALWHPQFDEAARWIAKTVEEDRAEDRTPLVSECKGQIDLDGIKLKGVADRIDGIGTTGLAIVDYKTGKPPSKKQVAAGLALQLGLIALIAERGGFDGARGTGQAFEYWSLGRAKDRTFGYRNSPTQGKDGLDPTEFVTNTLHAFSTAAAKWLTGDEPFTAKLHPDYAYAEYDHLMRLEEWLGRDV